MSSDMEEEKNPQGFFDLRQVIQTEFMSTGVAGDPFPKNRIWKTGLLLVFRFLIMVDKPAFIDTLPVLRVEFPLCIGFHRCMVFFPADNAFHKSRLLIYQFCGVLFPGHMLVVGYTGRNRC
jgi:hypothetical protein